MHHHTQIPSVPVNSGAYSALQLIKKAVTAKQATRLANALQDELNSPFLIKFAGMEGMK